MFLTFNFMSPLRKCFAFTLNSNPSVDVSRPSRPVMIESCTRSESCSAGSPLMNQFSRVAGLERPDVQFTFTVSPIWYLGRPPVIRGPSSGKTEMKIKWYNVGVSVQSKDTGTLSVIVTNDHAVFCSKMIWQLVWKIRFTVRHIISLLLFFKCSNLYI